MTAKRLAFDFLDVSLRPGKPRTTGLTIVRDRMRGLGEQREFLETYAQFVDYVKLSNMAPRLYPESFLVEKIRLYQQHDVTPFFGGILFENAYVQGKVGRLFSYLPEIDATSIEISDNIISIEEQELCSFIKEAAALGLKVFSEWGEKYPSRLFDLDRARVEIQGRLDAGASAVIVEQAELDQVFDGPDRALGLEQIKALAGEINAEKLIFETETRPQMVGMLEALGRDANLGPNIDFEEVKWLEPSRLGIGREIGHRTIEHTVGKNKVRSKRSHSA